MNRDATAVGAVKDELRGVVIFVAAVWVVFLLDCVVPDRWLPLNMLVLLPRRLSGIPGIVAMPFLHGGWRHIVGNTFPLFVLLTLLAGSRARSRQIVSILILASGTLLWVFGRPVAHVGASGLVFGLIGYLIASGLLKRRPVSWIVSLIVGFMYGGTLIWGVLPLQRGVSWDGHLCGAIAGVGVAYVLARESRATSDRLPAPGAKRVN